MYAIATSLLALSWLCGHVIGSPVATDASSEGKLFVPSLEEHEVHLKAMMEDAYTPEALARDSENNPQFTSDYPFDESEMEFLGEEKGYDDDEDDDDYFLDDEDDSFNGTALEARQAPCGQWSGTTRPASPKSPRHDFFHKQLTTTIVCGNGGSCGTSRTSTQTFSFGFNAAVTPVEWISGGFNVGRSYSTGNGHSCMGNPGGQVCLWKHVLYTSYRVRNGRYNSCTGFQATGNPFRIRSPNKGAARTKFYCVRGSACRGKGDGYWQTNV